MALGRPDARSGVATSDIWKVGGWTIQFARLASGRQLGLDQNEGKVYIKVLTGRLADIDRGPFAARKQVRDTLVSKGAVQAGDDGATLVVFTETGLVPDVIDSMNMLDIRGPLAETLQWVSFKKKFGKFTDIFDDLDAHLLPGFHLRDEAGEEIVYLHFWTAGKGVDCSTHDHSQAPAIAAPAFAEVHWVFQNGTGRGAMYECQAIGAGERVLTPLHRGQEHGPFWVSDPATGLPQRKANGALQYGFHGWQAGDDDSPGQSYDFVSAFEFNPDYAKV